MVLVLVLVLLVLVLVLLVLVLLVLVLLVLGLLCARVCILECMGSPWALGTDSCAPPPLQSPLARPDTPRSHHGRGAAARPPGAHGGHPPPR